MSELNAISKFITQTINDSNVVLFMKGTAELPACGFSKFVVSVLQKLSIDFKDINVLEDDNLRQGIKDYSQWPTIPQLYINKEFIGGSDIVRDMYNSGELFDFLDNMKINYKRP